MPIGLAIGGLGAIGSIGSAFIGSSAAKDAAKIQSDQAQRTAQMQMQLGQQGSNLIGAAVPNATNYLDPFINTGRSALTSLASLYGISTPGNPGGQQGQDQAWSNMLQTPAYQFAQSQGQLGLDRSAASRGLLLSGGQLKDTMSFNQGLATQQVGNYTNVLSGLASSGQSAAGMAGQMTLQGAQGQASALSNTAQMVGGTQLGGAQSAASGVVGSANALTGGIQNGFQNALTSYGISRQPNYGGVQNNPGGSLYNPSSYSNSFWNSAVNPGSNSQSFGWG